MFRRVEQMSARNEYISKHISKDSDPRMCVYCTVCKNTVDEMSKCYVSGIKFPDNSKVVSLSKNIYSKCRYFLR